MADILSANRRTVCFHYHTRSVGTQNNPQAIGSPVSEKSRFCLEDGCTAKLQPSRPSQGYIIEEFLSHPKTWDLDQQEQGR